MTIAWVIGRGGLLGSALERALQATGTTLFVPWRRFAWQDRGALLATIRTEASRFSEAVIADERWEIYWAAGVGTMSSIDGDLAIETFALDALLEAIGSLVARHERGCFVLASSAGAIYAGSADPVINEASLERPTTPYARAKLAHEQLARRYAEATGVRLLVARISTLYGVGQASGKPQGLLSHMSRCLVRNKTIQIYVSLDTIRDYITADDAAADMIEIARSLATRAIVMRIVASERPATISEIVSIFKRISRRPLRIVTSDAPASSVYARRIQFRSVFPPSGSRRPVSLAVGISQVLAAERLRYMLADRGNAPSG